MPRAAKLVLLAVGAAGCVWFTAVRRAGEVKARKAARRAAGGV